MGVGGVSSDESLRLRPDADRDQTTEAVEVQKAQRIPEARIAEEDRRFSTSVQGFAYTGKGSIIDDQV
ncbi:hypothetical protein [Desulfovibrio aminophilus]|uniref:hypothetical protein n=1 Tax=Desulfovibrio aminophilus TaxID=81425 RepID=UPI00339492CC